MINHLNVSIFVHANTFCSTCAVCPHPQEGATKLGEILEHEYNLIVIDTLTFGLPPKDSELSHLCQGGLRVWVLDLHCSWNRITTVRKISGRCIFHSKFQHLY